MATKAPSACCYCRRPLRTNEPYVQHPNGGRAHVACEIDARRQNRGRG